MGTFGKITIQTLHCHKGLLAKTFNDIILIQLVVIQQFRVLTHCKHNLNNKNRKKNMNKFENTSTLQLMIIETRCFVENDIRFMDKSKLNHLISFVFLFLKMFIISPLLF